jgi:PLP dependent protein
MQDLPHARVPGPKADAGLALRLAAVRERIAAAAARAGRPASAVHLLAVTKTVDARAVEALASLGIEDVGENRVLDALRKAGDVRAEVRARIRWHLIGHLQTNKVKKALELFASIHSIDSTRLARAVHEEAIARGRRLPVHFEVNVSGEASKGGFAPDELRAALPELLALSGLEVRGLMTMAPISDDPESSRPVFRALRELRDSLGGASALPALSMGMSGDFEVAVEEGSTCVRVGTALFGDPATPRSER